MSEIFDFGLQEYKIKMDGKFYENNLFAVAGDTGRRVEVQLLDTNNMVQNTSGIRLRLNAVVSSKATYAEAKLINANEGIYQLDLPSGMLLTPGNWQFQWQLIDTAGKTLNSFIFTGTIGSNLSEGANEAVNFYLNAEELKKLATDLQVKFNKIEADFIKVQQDASTINPSGAEVVMARGGQPTLGERLNLMDIVDSKVLKSINNIDANLINLLTQGSITKIKLIGDSITAGAGCAGYYEPQTRAIFDRGTPYGMQYETGTDWNLFPSWANLFRKYINTEYPSIDFFNMGIGGLQTKEVRDKFLDKIIFGSDRDGTATFVMLGTNDRSLTTLAEYKENIEYVLDYINQRSKVMIVMTATPSLSDFADTTYTDYAEARNFGAREIDNVLTTLCSEKGYTHISHYRGLLDYAAKTNTKLEDLLQPVGSHPVTKGYAVMWQTIQQRLGFANDVKEWFDGKRDVIHTESYNAVNVNTPITYFQSKSVSYHLIATTAVTGFPGNKAGTLETFRPSVEALDLWGYQLYHIYGTGELWYRQWKGSSWTSFETYRKESDAKLINLDYNTSTTSTKPLTDYPVNSLTKHPLRTANADLANFPEAKGGLLVTDRQLANYEPFSFQTYYIYQSNAIYRRYWTGSAWSAWAVV